MSIGGKIVTSDLHYGPTVEVRLSCWNCVYFRMIKSPEPFNPPTMTCTRMDDRPIDHFGVPTPDWCPYLPSPTAEWSSSQFTTEEIAHSKEIDHLRENLAKERIEFFLATKAYRERKEWAIRILEGANS